MLCYAQLVRVGGNLLPHSGDLCDQHCDQALVMQCVTYTEQSEHAPCHTPSISRVILHYQLSDLKYCALAFITTHTSNMLSSSQLVCPASTYACLAVDGQMLAEANSSHSYGCLGVAIADGL